MKKLTQTLMLDRELGFGETVRRGGAKKTLPN